MSERTLVIAATNLLARGFLVVPTDRKSRAGEPVNGLFAVARALLHVLDWKTPARAVAIVDRRGRDWPDLLVPQLEQLPDLLRAFGVHVVEAEGEPQLVASYARAAVEAADDVVIVGMDKRFAQLVEDGLWWYDAYKDVRYTPELVRKRFEVPPAQVADWLALVGDDDVLPGVDGIGKKGATDLLQSFGSLSSAIARADDVPGRTGKMLRAGRDAAASEALQQPCLCARGLTTGSSGLPGRRQTASSVAPERMNSPITSCPCCLSSQAEAELSTPPLMARTTRDMVRACVGPD